MELEFINATSNHGNYPVIGRCIYCGSTEDLSDEHCVPRSLNGLFQLKKASCGECRDMTSSFERKITRHTLGEARAVMQYKTRRPKERKQSYPIEVRSAGESRIVDVPVNVLPGVVPALDLGIATYLAEKYFPNDQTVPVGLKGVQPLVFSRSPTDLKNFLENIGADSIHPKLKMDIFEFARMLAKIAYCYSIGLPRAEGIQNSLEEVYVLGLIKGDISDPWRYVGGQPAAVLRPENPQTNPDAIAISVKDGDVLCHVQLFVQTGGPEYLIAVGRASDELREWLE
jgi:hypothetical protein